MSPLKWNVFIIEFDDKNTPYLDIHKELCIKQKDFIDAYFNIIPYLEHS